MDLFFAGHEHYDQDRAKEVLDALENYKEYGFTEAYEVVRIAEMVMDERTHRIEIMKCFSNPSVPFTARGWVEEDVTLQPTLPQSGGKYARKPESMSVWIDAALPWVARETPDSALAQALGFLAERKKR